VCAFRLSSNKTALGGGKIALKKQTRSIILLLSTMASETEPETIYKEAPFAEEVKTVIPVKVHIVAPSTLPEGYVFDAEVGPPGNKKTVTVEVVRSCQHQCLTVGLWRRWKVV
jgi:hypothetical protein